MILSKDEILKRIDSTLALYANARSQAPYDDLSGGSLDYAQRVQLAMQLSSTIDKFAPFGSTQRKAFDRDVANVGNTGHINSWVSYNL